MPTKRCGGSAKGGQVGRTALGKAIENDRRKRSDFIPAPRAERATGVSENQAGRSVLEQSSLDDFIAQTHLSQANFETDRYGQRFVEEGPRLVTVCKELTSDEAQAQQKAAARITVPIPWRPPWQVGNTADDLLSAEGAAFLEWRRNLSKLEQTENVVMTPYERNLDFWRQLWRCIERSDVLVQIVDARDPAFYRSRDLERYVATRFPEKQHVLLMNKSDFLSQDLRKRWSAHFASNGIEVIFFSALRELHRQQRIPGQDNSQPGPACEESKDEATRSGARNDELEQKTLDGVEAAAESVDRRPSEKNVEPLAANSADPKLPPHGNFDACEGGDVLGCVQLMDVLRAKAQGWRADDDPAANRNAVVGFVGYPNVGKSSVINALFGAKKVSVSRIPGKTKHLQTLDIPGSDITLCDCPGLVFPSVVATQAHLAINGTVPVVELRDHISPVRLIVGKLGASAVGKRYGLTDAAIKDGVKRLGVVADDARRVLAGFAVMRQKFLRLGVPDETWAARVILNDYCTGSLIHCELPDDGSALPSGRPSAQEVQKLPNTAACTQAVAGDDDSDFSDLDDFLAGNEKDGGGSKSKAGKRHGPGVR